MPSISTINSSALNQNNAQQLSSTQQIGLSSFQASFYLFRSTSWGYSFVRSISLHSKHSPKSDSSVVKPHVAVQYSPTATECPSDAGTLARGTSRRTWGGSPTVSFEGWCRNIELFRMYSNLLRQRECKVCLSNLATVLFLPCGHLSVCPACAPRLQGVRKF